MVTGGRRLQWEALTKVSLRLDQAQSGWEFSYLVATSVFTSVSTKRKSTSVLDIKEALSNIFPHDNLNCLKAAWSNFCFKIKSHKLTGVIFARIDEADS